MKTIACVVVSEPWAFAWLGNRNVLRWTLDSLAEVRGIDATMVCAVTDIRYRLNGSALTIDKIVADADGHEGVDALLHNICSGNTVDSVVHEAQAILVVHPKCPFLSAVHYEMCVASLDTGSPDVAFTYPVDILEGTRIRPASAALSRIRATALGTRPGSTRAVEIGRIEAIDVSCPEGMRMAQSLVDTGVL